MQKVIWKCPKVQRLSIRVYKEGLLHRPISDFTNTEQKLITFIFLATCQTIAKVWGQPSLNMKVKQQIMGTMYHKISTSILNDTHYLKIWTLWLEYNRNLNLDHSLLSL